MAEMSTRSQLSILSEDTRQDVITPLCQDPSSGRAEKLVVPSAGGLTEDSVLSFLRDNPGLLQQLDRLQLPAPAKSERQILPPVIPPGPGTPGN